MRWFAFAFLLSTCLGNTGPELPPNVGMSHGSRGGATRAPEPEPPAEPVEIGTAVWANYRDTGFHFHGIVVERREDLQHRVIYADGSSEWVAADALRPDSLGADARINVRATFQGEFAEATVSRRLGDAIYVRAPGGEERWTALPHVRFQRGDEGTPAPDDAPAEAPPGGVEVGHRALVNYQAQGLRFAATVTATAEDGRLHVVYLDGETEWVNADLVSPDDLTVGSEVHVRRSWEPAEWVRGHVRVRHGHAFSVELEDGAVVWTALFLLRAPVPTPDVPEEEVTEPEVTDTPPPRARRRRRRRRGSRTPQ